jgi:hypothetical protein
VPIQSFGELRDDWDRSLALSGLWLQRMPPPIRNMWRRYFCKGLFSSDGSVRMASFGKGPPPGRSWGF